jgi:PleD family two-component response regulator
VIAEHLVSIMGRKVKVKNRFNRGIEYCFNLNFPKANKVVDSPDRFNYNVSVICHNLMNDKLTEIISKLCDLLRINFKVENDINSLFSFKEENRFIATTIVLVNSRVYKLELVDSFTILEVGNKPTAKHHIKYPLTREKMHKTILSIIRLKMRSMSAPKINSSDELPKQRVLLAEDHLLNSKMVVRMLQQLGHECDPVYNGKEAVIQAQAKEYDLILMVRFQV